MKFFVFTQTFLIIITNLMTIDGKSGFRVIEMRNRLDSGDAVMNFSFWADNELLPLNIC